MSLSSEYRGPAQGPEAKKIFCAYHRTEFLTNFCIEKQCLMPLCPSCVAEHTEQHYRCSHKPTYVNLNEALHEVKQKCYASIVGLEECSRKNDDIIRYREGLEQNLHDQLTQCKQEIFLRIEQIFQKYQTKLIKEIEQHYEELSVYEPDESQTIKEYTTEQIEILYDKISLLKSDQCLAALIRFYDHEQEEYEDGLRDVNEYLNKHKKVGIVSVRVLADAMATKLENLCQDLLVMSHVRDQDKAKEQGKGNIRNSKIKRTPSSNSLAVGAVQKQKPVPLATKTLNVSINKPPNNAAQKNKYQNIY